MKLFFSKISTILFIFLFLLDKVTPLCEDIEKSEANPTKCTSENAADSENEECCYLEGFSETYKGEKAEPECVEIKKSHTQNDGTLEGIISGIVKGEYWKYAGYEEKYVEIDKVVCKNSKFEKSDCETNHQDPDGIKDCREGKTKNDKEICCFLDGGEEGKECVDILKSDEKNTKDIKDKIKKGEYWEDYTRTYDEIKNLKCGSRYIKYSVMSLILVFSIMF